MLLYCSSGSQASKSEYFVSLGPVLFLRGDGVFLGNGGGLNTGFPRAFGARGDGLGTLEGLPKRAFGFEVSGYKDNSAIRAVIEKVLEVSRRSIWG